VEMMAGIKHTNLIHKLEIYKINCWFLIPLGMQKDGNLRKRPSALRLAQYLYTTSPKVFGICELFLLLIEY